MPLGRTIDYKMAAYAGLSLQEIYSIKCDEIHCKKNSWLVKNLPMTPGDFETLERLDLSNNFVGPKGLLPVLEIVKVCSSLTYFSLKDNQLTNQSTCDVCDVLAIHPGIVNLDISNNPVTLSAGKALLELAQKNPRMRKIILDDTNIRPMLVRSITSQCAQNQENARMQRSMINRSVNVSGLEDGSMVGGASGPGLRNTVAALLYSMKAGAWPGAYGVCRVYLRGRWSSLDTKGRNGSGRPQPVAPGLGLGQAGGA